MVEVTDVNDLDRYIALAKIAMLQMLKRHLHSLEMQVITELLGHLDKGLKDFRC